MLYYRINALQSPQARILAALASLLLLPLLLAFALVYGTALHLIDFAKAYGSDLYQFVIEDVPSTFSKLARVVTTGGLIR